jgi:hypothetical protein
MPLARLGNALLRSGAAICTDCCEPLHCGNANTEFVFTVSGVTTGGPPCSAANCNAHNTTNFLPEGAVSINMRNACGSFGTPAFTNEIFSNPDYVCSYTLWVPRCGLKGAETWALDAQVFGKYNVVNGGAPGGWLVLVGIRSATFSSSNTNPGNYNFDSPTTFADYCIVMGVPLSGSGELLDFNYVFTQSIDNCGGCTVSSCDYDDMIITASVQLA